MHSKSGLEIILTAIIDTILTLFITTILIILISIISIRNENIEYT
jgi:hypothetical protein